MTFSAVCKAYGRSERACRDQIEWNKLRGSSRSRLRPYKFEQCFSLDHWLQRPGAQPLLIYGKQSWSPDSSLPFESLGHRKAKRPMQCWTSPASPPSMRMRPLRWRVDGMRWRTNDEGWERVLGQEPEPKRWKTMRMWKSCCWFWLVAAWNGWFRCL